MKLTNVHLSNFRCFQDYTISFGTRATVLIGKNGTGKTTLLTALRKGMSFMFAQSRTNEKSISESNNCNVRSFGLWDARFDEVNRLFCLPIQNDFNATYNGKNIQWTALKTKDPGGLHSTSYKEALESILSGYNADLRNSNLPLVAFFSDSYPHVLSKVGVKAAKIVKQDVLPRDFAYYGWDEDSNCIELWQRRYIKISNYLNDITIEIIDISNQIGIINRQIESQDVKDPAKIIDWGDKRRQLADKLVFLTADKNYSDFKKEKDFIDNKIETFTRPLRDDLKFINTEFQIVRTSVNRPDRKSFSIEFTFSDGRAIHFDILPAGYRRLLSIVLDLAYRSYILNEDRQTEGVSIIDEIDLHLHPTLQQEVLQRFQKTFPDIQFIVSTHSPLVISNLKADGIDNKIIKLKNEGDAYSNQEVENIYGIDYTTGVTEIMGAHYRKSEIDSLIDSIVILINYNKNDEAERLKTELFNIVGNNNTYIINEINNRVEMNKME